MVRIATESIVDERREEKSKVIVCASSEPAIDELSRRLIDLNSKLSTSMAIFFININSYIYTNLFTKMFCFFSPEDKLNVIRVGEISDPTDTKVFKIQLRAKAEESVKQMKRKSVVCF